MTTPSWPSSLPAVPLLGNTERAPEMTIRSQMDVGPGKVRRRSIAAVRPRRVAWIMAESQVNALDQFFVTTLAGGSLRFNCTDPRTGGTVQMRFAAPPEYEQIGGSPVRYRVTAELEQMP